MSKSFVHPDLFVVYVLVACLAHALTMTLLFLALQWTSYLNDFISYYEDV